MKNYFTRTNIKDMYLLSPMQEGMLFHTMLDPGTTAYLEQLSYRLDGCLNLEKYKQAFHLLVERYDVFRTVFLYEKMDKPRQIVLKEFGSEIHFEDISELPVERQKEYIEQWKLTDKKRGFQLAKENLIRLAIFKSAVDSYTMVWTFHHIIMDGWCFGIIIEDFFQMYRQLVADEPLQLQPTHSYSEYIRWLEKQDKNEAVKYWQQTLQGYEEQAIVPSLYSNPKDLSYDLQIATMVFDEATTKNLAKVASSHHLTLNTVIQTAWGVLLQKYNRTYDVIFGSIVSGRPVEIEGIEKMVGLFIAAIPTRVQGHGEMKFSQLAEQVQHIALQSERYAYYPLAEIQSATILKQNLFDHIMIFENYPLDEAISGVGENESKLGFTISDVDAFTQTHYNLNLVLAPGRELVVKFKYNAQVYTLAEMERVQGHFQEIIHQIIENPKVQLKTIHLMTTKERVELLERFNQERTELPKVKSILELFTAKAKSQPEKVAVVDKAKHLTYGELNERAGCLAAYLRRSGLARNEIIGIITKQSVDTIVGILAVWKAGGAYLPIDIDSPKERIQFMLQDSGAKILLTPEAEMGMVAFSGETIALDDDRYYQGPSTIEEEIGPADLAYVIYTSGTTGQPKGVLLEHHGLTNYVVWFGKKAALTTVDKTALLSSFAFDLGYTVVFPALAFGTELHILTKTLYSEPEELLAYLDREKITYLKLTPSLFNMIVSSALFGQRDTLESLRLVVLGGEQINLNDVERLHQLYPATQVINHYGPTEATIGSIAYLIDFADFDTYRQFPVIGRPIDNARVYVLDADLHPLPQGVSGEIYIAGEGLARGYLNRPELTAEKFIQSPFKSGEILYKTGDLGYYLPNGTIIFQGRVDHQVKIRGYRVELGEIETRLLQVEGVQKAFVLSSGSGVEQVLCAYLVTTAELDVVRLRKELHHDLPEYMVPTHIITLDQLPLTPNGKVDRKALPAPGTNQNRSEEFVEPRTEIEKRLAQIWREILHVESVSVNDNFFALGGHSLKAMALSNRVQKEFQIELPLRQIFRVPTIREQARLIIGGREGEVVIEPVGVREYYPVSSPQKRIYILQQLEGANTSYNIPRVMIINGMVDVERFSAVFKKLVERHEPLRTSFALVDGEIVQKIESKLDFQVTYADVVDVDIDSLIKEFVQPFNLAQAPLFRVSLLKISQEKYLFLFDIHHIISDGGSTGILVNEFAQLYNNIALEPLKIQYKDYAVWQQAYLQSEEMKESEQYWLEQFKDSVPVLNLPTDYQRPSTQSFAGDTVHFTLDNELTERLKKLAQETKTTVFMQLLAVYNLMLWKYTGQEDLIVGTPISGRIHADLHPVVGMFVNTLAMRNHPQGNQSYREFLASVRENSLKAYEHQGYQFEELVEKLHIERDLSRNPLFDTMLVLQNAEGESVSIGEISIEPYELPHQVAKFDLTLHAFEGKDGIGFSLEYCTKLFQRPSIIQMAEHLLNLITQIIQQPEQKLSEIDMLSPTEKELILYKYNQVKADYPKSETIIQLFETQAASTPEKVALVEGEKTLNYEQCNKIANRLARYLRKNGVKPNQTVGVLMERSMEFVLSILAIQKAGGAYIPIDTAYPVERISYILQDSEAEILLASKSLEKLDNFPGVIITVEEALTEEMDGSNLELLHTPEDLVYLIYTSGTTGNPKGVMIHHQGLINYLWWAKEVYLQGSVLDFPLYSSVSFDLTVTSLYLPLLTGGRLVIYPEVEQGQLIRKVVQDNQVDIVKLTPTHLRLLEGLDYSESRIRGFIVGGEDLKTDLARKISTAFAGRVKIYNEYGPTETVVGCMIYQYDPASDLGASVPIGIPAANVQIYLLDNYLKPVQIGGIGEIYISGDGVALGYKNRPELTAERFLPNPFVPGTRMYKTGDLARRLHNGNLIYIGRIDQQVKIRGYRIELEEIEKQLALLPHIEEALVIDREDSNGNKFIAAYYVAGKELKASELRERLRRVLPEYMLPTAFLQLDKLPLTPNGKVDRKALPDPLRLQTKNTYLPPTNKLEELLVEIWQVVLGAENIGIVDNFFALGGDSIKAIQIIARLQQHGYQLEMKELFQAPTIVEVSKYIRQNVRQIDQREVTGEVRLTPIQHWFFEQRLINAEHWNQSVMLYRKEGFSPEIVSKVFSALVKHHDALRMIFPIVEGEVVQVNRPILEDMFTLETLDFTKETNLAERIEAEAERIQRSICLERGPVVKLGIFKTTVGDHLLIAAHHLVIDGISWRILFEDLTSAYQQALLDAEIHLPEKTDSYQYWAEKLYQYAESPELLQELPYWQTIESVEVAPLPKDHLVRDNLQKDKKTSVIHFTQEETQQLLKETNRWIQVEINDLLLTALSLACGEWAGLPQILVNLEGHGREEIIQEVNITRTIGWFTSLYPVLLNNGLTDNYLYQLKMVKENLRNVPNRGVGYGILKYLTPQEKKGVVRFRQNPEISFNYLGQFGTEMAAGALELSSYPRGESVSPDSERQYTLAISGMVAEECLHLMFEYNQHQYDEETIEKLANIYKNKLLALKEACLTLREQEWTPSDFDYRELSIEQFERLQKEIAVSLEVAKIEPENIYPLSPMQQGMLYTQLAAPESNAYFEQTILSIKGQIDLAILRASIQQLIQRYDVFRTIFTYKRVPEPAQIVLKYRPAEVHFENLSNLSVEEQEHWICAWVESDRSRGFDLEKDILMRITVLQLGEQVYKIIWSFHHIIMDGWCMGIIIQEFFQMYKAIAMNEQLNLSEVQPFGRYIQWLARQKREAAKEYWQNYLINYTKKATFEKNHKGVSYQRALVNFELEAELAAGVEALARKNHVTPNTVYQALWGLLLQKYNHTDDVVFGAVVSGRPSEIHGIERMVGLFINTIPVRVQADGGTSFIQLLEKGQEKALHSEKYDYFPLAEIQANSSSKQETIDQIIIFENYPVEKQIEESSTESVFGFTVTGVQTFEQTNYDWNIVIKPGTTTTIEFCYNAQVYAEELVYQVKEHFLELMRKVVSEPDLPIRKLELISAEMKSYIMEILEKDRERLQIDFDF